MADSTFGLKIGLEGEREFKRAITDINREMRVLGSEMKVVASQFGKNATDADALTARNQVLSREIEAQRSKVTTLAAALDNAASSFGESDSRTQNWRIQLNNATATLNDMERELGENTAKIDELSTAAGSSEGEFKDAASGADKLGREVDDLGREMDDTSGKTRVFGDVLKANLAAEAIIGGVKAIGSAIAGIGRGFASAMKDGVAYNAEMEQYTTNFTTMLGDQAKAQKLVNDLKVTAAKTPFGMGDLAKNTQTLMAFGISADEAKLRLGQLGDISQGDAQKLESLTLAFAQVSSAGKLSGQDLLQMINAGFNPLQEMSKKTGKSVGELKEEMEKGAISADMVAEAFASATAEGGQFYGAMEAQSKTFSGQMSTLEDGINGLKGALAGGLTAMLASTVLPMVNGWVDTLTTAFEEGGIDGLLGALDGILTQAPDFLSAQLPVVLDIALKAITALVEALVNSAPQLAAAAVQILQTLATAILTALPLLVDAALQIIGTLATGIGQALPTLIPAIVSALPQIITAVITGVLGAIPLLIDASIKLLTALIGALPQIIQTLVAAMPTIIAAVVGALLAALPQLIQAGIRLLTALVGALPQIISTILGAVPQILGALIGGLGQGYGRMLDVGMNLVRGLWSGIQQLAGWLWNKVSGWIKSIWDGITSFFGIHSPSRQMAWVGDMLTRGLAGGIQTTGARAVAAAEDMAEGVSDTLSSLTGGVSIPVKMAPSTRTQAGTGTGSVGVGDVEAVAVAAARAVLDKLDVSVRLSDGTLVGKLTPLIDRQLAARGRTSALLAPA